MAQTDAGVESKDSEEENGAECVSIRARGVELPDDPQERSAFLDVLSEIVRDTLEENHDLSPDTVTGRAGYEYAQVPARCPKCDGELEISEMEPHQENGAFGFSKCTECSYNGGVTYRMIDLQSSSGDGGAVKAGERTPNYIGY